MHDDPGHDAADAPLHAPDRRRSGAVIAWTAVVLIIAAPLIVGGVLIKRQRAVERLRDAGVYVDTETVGPQWIVDRAGDWYPRYVNRVTRVSVFHGSALGDAELASLVVVDADPAELSLLEAPVTDVGARHLAHLDTLKSLSLSDTRITDEGLRYVGELDGLMTLYLAGCDVGDAGMAHVGRLPRLKTLGLADTHVGDTGLAHLADARELIYLDLSKTQVTDAGLVHLEGLTNLQVVYAIDTQVTSEGAARLRAALPNVWIGVSPAPAAQ